MLALYSAPPRFLTPIWGSNSLCQLCRHRKAYGEARRRLSSPSADHARQLRNGLKTLKVETKDRVRDDQEREASRNGSKARRDEQTQSEPVQTRHRSDVTKAPQLASNGSPVWRFVRGNKAAEEHKRPPSRGLPVDTGRLRNTGADAAAVKHGDVAEDLAPSTNLPPLFEELFPAESQRNKQPLYPDVALPSELDVALPDLDLHPNSFSPETEGRAQQRVAARARWRELLEQRKITLMVIAGLSPTLDETDFQRLIPRGSHIEEWRTAGDVLRVIPGRDSASLRPSGVYYLVFGNTMLARAYKTHVEHWHAVAREHTPTSLLSPPLPARGLYLQGEHVHQMVQDYALCPPSHDLRCGILTRPYDRRIQRLLADMGDATLQNTGPAPKAGRSVLFWIDGMKPSLKVLKAVLSRDGHARGLPWGALQPGDNILPLDAASKGWVARPLQPRRDEGTGHALDQPVDQPLDADDGTGRAADQPLDPLLDEDEEDDRASHGASWPAHGGDRVRSRRWLLTFADEPEARRFLRAWHRRPYPRDFMAGKAARYAAEGEPLPAVHVEFVW